MTKLELTWGFFGIIQLHTDVGQQKKEEAPMVTAITMYFSDHRVTTREDQPASWGCYVSHPVLSEHSLRHGQGVFLGTTICWFACSILCKGRSNRLGFHNLSSDDVLCGRQGGSVKSFCHKYRSNPYVTK
jgi:hypothetical protein